MIRAAGVADRQRVHAQVLERLHPLLENRRDRLVALQVDAADQPGAVVHIEVAGQLPVLRLQLHRRRVAEVGFDVFARAEQSLFFAAPQPDAHRAAQGHAADLQQPHRFHHHRRSRRIVGGASAGVPRVEMPADHHYLVRLVRARQLGNDVEGVLIRVVERAGDVHRQRDRDLLVERPPDAAVMFGRQRHLRRLRRAFRIARDALRRLHEDRAAITAAEVEHRRNALVDPELRLLAIEILRAAEGAAPAAPAPGRRLLRQIDELGVRVTVTLRLEMRLDVAQRHRQHELPAQLAAERVEVLLFVDQRDDGVTGHLTVGAGRPGFRVADQRIGARRYRHRGEHLILPAAAERPRLEVHVREAPLLHRLLRPVGGFLDVGGAGEARTVDVGEVALDLHDLRALKAFVLDLVDRVEVEFLRHRPLRGERQRHHDEQDDDGA